MAVNYVPQFTGTLEVLENLSAAGDRPAILIGQWLDHLRAEDLGDVADELQKFSTTLERGNSHAIGLGLTHLSEVVLAQSKATDDVTLRDRLTQLASALAKTGRQFASN